MKTSKTVKSNRIILIANQLAEHSEPSAKESLSVDVLLKHARNQSTFNLCREDIFIGEACKWKDLYERLDEYLDLAHLRAVNVEVFYFCPFSFFTENLVGKEEEEYLHFYDQCIKGQEMAQLEGHTTENFQIQWFRLKAVSDYFEWDKQSTMPLGSSSFSKAKSMLNTVFFNSIVRNENLFNDSPLLFA